MNILVLYYSQTGKTRDIVDCYLDPLKGHPNINIDIVEIEPQSPFPFPWPMLHFFSIVPETVYMNPVPLKEINFDVNKKYDLIVLGCQVWFLSPSLPISSMLQHSENKVFRNTPVMLILTCRKMWFQTYLDIERKLKELDSWIYEKAVVTVSGSQLGTLFRTRDNLLKRAGEYKDTDSSRTWKFNQEELDMVKKKGRELVAVYEASKGDMSSIFLKKHKVQEETIEETYKQEKVAKNYFFFTGKYIQRYSKPVGPMRTIFTSIFTVFFMILIFLGLPLSLLSSKIKRLYDSNII
jgi:hypothetical protein